MKTLDLSLITAKAVAQRSRYGCFIWIAMVFGLSAIPGSAQSFTLDWFTIDGGGGTSIGGGYSVSGTIGQPDTGPASGGGYSLQGGFWSIVPATTPVLSIRRSGNDVIISWPVLASGFRLQENPSLNAAGWTYVATPPIVVGSENQVTVSSLVGNRFYQLRNP